MLFRYHEGMHSNIQLSFLLFGQSDQLYCIANLPGVSDVGRGDPGDTFPIDLRKGDPAVKGDRGQNSYFSRGIIAFDVSGRVSLGVTQPLSFLQNVAEGQTLLTHLSQ